jgi:hypothetical protein
MAHSVGYNILKINLEKVKFIGSFSENLHYGPNSQKKAIFKGIFVHAILELFILSI